MDDENDEVEDFGFIDLLERTSKVLRVAEDAGSAVEGTRAGAIEIRDNVEGIAGAPFVAMDKVDSIRDAVSRLTDPKRPEPPGTIETVFEIGSMLFGGK